MQQREFVAHVVAAVGLALLGAEEDQLVSILDCPGCNDLLMLDVAAKELEHMVPVCPQWSEYCENWKPEKA